MNMPLVLCVATLALGCLVGCSKSESTSTESTSGSDGAASTTTAVSPQNAQAPGNAPGGSRTVVISDGGVKVDGVEVKKDSVTTPTATVKKDSVKTGGVEVTKDGVKTPGGVNVKIPQ